MEKHFSQKSYSVIILAVLISVCVMIAVFLGFRRNIYHVDEIFQFGISNNMSGSLFYDFDPDLILIEDTREHADMFFDKWNSGTFFKEYITVNEGERFRYDNVYYNTGPDCHPPLSYYITHTISSVFTGKFSKWMMLIPNIVFYVLSIIFLYLIVEMMTDSGIKAVIAAAFWALSGKAIADVLFMRMYMLLTLEALMMFYFTLRLLCSEDKKEMTGFGIGIFLMNTAGFLTHYYFYIFSFFVTAGACFIWLIRRKYKTLFIYAGSVLLSVVTSIALFPWTVDRLINSGYATAAADKISLKLLKHAVVLIGSPIDKTINTLVEIVWTAAYVFCDIFNIEKYPDKQPIYLTIRIISTVIVVAAGAFFLKKHKNFSDKSAKELFRSLLELVKKRPVWIFLFIAFSAMSSYIVIAAVQPSIAGRYIDRYSMHIFPFIFITNTFIIIKLSEFVIKKRKWNKALISLPCAIMLVFSVTSIFSNDAFLFYMKDHLDISETIKGQTCFYVSDGVWTPNVHVLSPEFSNADKVYCALSMDEKLHDEVLDAGECYFIIAQRRNIKSGEYIKTRMAEFLYDIPDIEYLGTLYDYEDVHYVFRVG